jgi:hypothetical protein
MTVEGALSPARAGWMGRIWEGREGWAACPGKWGGSGER